MTENKLQRAINGIDEKYLQEAATYVKTKKKSVWVKWVSFAACLAVIATGGILIKLLGSLGVPTDSINSYFVITAHAANEESKDLDMSDNFSNSGFLSSGTSQVNIFGHNIPLFNFDVRPSSLKDNETMYARFDVSVYYGGVLVDGKDEHIRVAFVASKNNPLIAYSVIGWFTEPTDVEIVITDRETQSVVETITLNVRYLSDTEQYELKVTKLDTEYGK